VELCCLVMGLLCGMYIVFIDAHVEFWRSRIISFYDFVIKPQDLQG